MRTIKFRAYDSMDWIYSSAVDYREHDDQWCIYDFEEEEWLYCGIPEQFTGLFDKNGKEIYENDIVYQISERTYESVTGIVKFIDGSYVIEKVGGADGVYLFDEVGFNEVIGNVFDNPELLAGDS